MAAKHQVVWYYSTAGILGDKTHGPFSEQAFSELCRDGKVALEDLVCCPARHGQKWTKCADIPSIAKLIRDGKVHRERKLHSEIAHLKFVKLQEKEERQRQREHERIALEHQAEQRRAEEQRLAAEQQRAAFERQQQEIQAVHQQAQASPFHRHEASPLKNGMVRHVEYVDSPDMAARKLAAILINFLCLPGVGQLILERYLLGLFFLGGWLISLVLIPVYIGLLMAPIVWLIALIDVATYRKHRIYWTG